MTDQWTITYEIVGHVHFEPVRIYTVRNNHTGDFITLDQGATLIIAKMLCDALNKYANPHVDA